MPATIGATNTSGYSVPTGCVLKKSAVKSSIGTVKYRSAAGVTIANIPTKIVTTTHTLDLVGAAALTAVTAGAFTSGTAKATSIRVSETAEGVPESTVTLTAFA